jgi:hypothetical protein
VCGVEVEDDLLDDRLLYGLVSHKPVLLELVIEHLLFGQNFLFQFIFLVWSGHLEPLKMVLESQFDLSR